jgi:hypothetical protein
MVLGVALPTPTASWSTVKRAENAGFGSAWFYDTQVLKRGNFRLWKGTAVITKSIHLRAGVLISSNRTRCSEWPCGTDKREG